MILATLLAAILTAQSPKAVDTLLWDFPDDVVGVVVFKTCFDSAPCEFKDPVVVKVDADSFTPAGHSTYGIPIPALTPGDHTATVHACYVVAPDDCPSRGEKTFSLRVALPETITVRTR